MMIMWMSERIVGRVPVRSWVSIHHVGMVLILCTRVARWIIWRCTCRCRDLALLTTC